MVKYNDYCKRFCEIESWYHLFDLEYKDIKYWKYARFYLDAILRAKLFGEELEAWIDDKNKEQCRLFKYNNTFQRITDKVLHNPAIGCKNKDVLLFSFGRRVKEGGKYVCPVTDEIALHLERSNCIVETPYFWGYYRPALIRRIKYYDAWDGVGIKSNTYISISQEELETQLLNIFEKEFDIVFTSEEKQILTTNINYYVMYHEELKENFKKVLKYINPKVVLYAESFTGEKVVLTEALKEMRIPSIEILHGYMTNNTVEYNYLEVGCNNALPDYIFAYSQVQKDIIRWGIPKEHVRVVGSPWLEKRKKELESCISQKREKKVITFISNTNLAIVKYLMYLVESLDCNRYEIKFKVHPTELKNNYQNLPESIQIIDGNEKDIHYYLANSDIVIGIASTALYEAAIYPVEIYILKENGFEIMNVIIESNRATLVDDPEQLYKCITCKEINKSIKSVSFFAQNAVENINKYINEIIEETGRDY